MELLERWNGGTAIKTCDFYPKRKGLNRIANHFVFRGEMSMAKGGWRQGAGRPTLREKAESCRSIDVRQFKRHGLFQARWQGSWFWKDSRTGSVVAEINLQTWQDYVSISYRWNGQAISELVRLARTPSTFGGKRHWFLCPGCLRRGAILYQYRGRFRCRSCHDLRYQSQAVDPIDRTWLAQAKVERKIGRSRSRPKGMHKTTYERLAAKLTTVERERRAIMIAGLRRAMGMD